MAKKIIVGIVLLLIIMVGGFFLLLLVVPSEKKPVKSEYTSTPTTWSQKEDYKVEQVNGKTVVTNSKAGFSFVVPEGWILKGENYGEREYFLNLLNPLAKFDQDNFLISGCFINIQAMYQKDDIASINTHIETLKKNPNLLSGQKVIEIDGKSALQISTISALASNDPSISKRISDTVQLQVPINESSVGDFKLIMKKQVEKECLSTLNQFLTSILFK